MSEASPIGLLAVGFASALGAVIGLRAGVVRYRAAAVIGITGMALAPVGVYAAGLIPNAPLTVAFSSVLAVVAFRTFKQVERTKAHDDALGAERLHRCRLSPIDGRLIWTWSCATTMARIGAVSGFLSGLLGVGGGFVIVPALMRYTDIPVRSIVTTSQAIIALVSFGAIAAAAWKGSIHWQLAWPFALGAAAALLVGQLLLGRLAPARIRQTFGAVCAIVSLLMLARGIGWMPL